MKNYPKLEKGSVTGPNARVADALVAARKRALEKLEAVYHPAAVEFQRATRKLLSKADVRRAARIASDLKAEWQQSNLTGNGDAAKWASRKRAAVSKVKRTLTGALPSLNKWAALRDAHRRDWRKLSARYFNGLTVVQAPPGWGVLTPPVVPVYKRFLPPFAVADVSKVDESGIIETDESSVHPGFGFMVNDLVFDHDEDTAVILGVYGMLGRAKASGQASCGINYTVPETGRLQIMAELENFYNHVTLSLKDSWGFSEGKLLVTINLTISVVRLLEVISLPKILFTTTLISGGSDTNSVMPDMEPLYVWDRSTSETFTKNEVVSILVGSEVQVYSELDDMRSNVGAVLGWKLKRLSVGVLPAGS